MSKVEKLVIIGSGPAGWTAALYAARANLDPLLLEGVPQQTGGYVLPGGQLMLTTDVENYPGYPEGVLGPQMMQDFKKQALRFDTRVEGCDVVECDFEQRPFVLKTVNAGGDKGTSRAHAVIVATGATANWLGLESEQRLARSGGGVSACAVCDGALPIFRDKRLVVIGGGDSAMEEASYLAKFASKVHIIHRRDELRASKIMQKRVLDNPKCEVIWNTVITDVLGNDHITGVRFQDVKSGQERDFECGGLFLAIGHTPATQFLQGCGLDLDDEGYVKLTAPPQMFTSIEGVFAAGDVADAVYRQAVTAAGMGCQAALDAERWLAGQSIE
ncbi:MAG: thioredoxin-disulfide reductase [Planctomycetota bacterium]|nr:thioredoxin-disulfide reductase [Planctomycetota bacterium]